jgi:hypothetical protein
LLDLGVILLLLLLLLLLLVLLVLLVLLELHKDTRRSRMGVGR